MIRIAAVGVALVCSVPVAPYAQVSLPDGYPPSIREAQSVPRLVQQHAKQSLGAPGAPAARTACDASMPAWNAWVEALTGALSSKGQALPKDFDMRTEAASKAAATCAVARLAAVNLPAIPERELSDQQTNLTKKLRSAGEDTWRTFTRSSDEKRQAAVQYLNDTLRWKPWGEAR
jgi:hypothetical protein